MQAVKEEIDIDKIERDANAVMGAMRVAGIGYSMWIHDEAARASGSMDARMKVRHKAPKNEEALRLFQMIPQLVARIRELEDSVSRYQAENRELIGDKVELKEALSHASAVARKGLR